MASVFKKYGRGPWIIKWTDHQGRRRERSSRTTDKRAAQRLGSKLEADAALRREGVIDPRLDAVAEANACPIQAHIDAYLTHLRAGDRSPLTMRDARAHLGWAVKETGAARLVDLSLDAVTKALDGLRAKGRSARTVNHARARLHAFVRWCERTSRITSNPLKHLPKLNEDRDRRRIRRALTDDEVARLFEAADERGRGLWYRVAFWLGLRRSELLRLTWGDVDLDRLVVTVRMGKAKRVDRIPIHPDMTQALREAGPGLATARIFPTGVSNKTRQSDFDRAGIPRRDEKGFHLDLHSLRSSLATRLAREGIPPQIAQRILRHADYRTTIKHYNSLTEADDASAMARLKRPERGPTTSPTTQGTKQGHAVRDGAKVG